MKNILIGVGVVVIAGGATYALVPRSVLKQYFQTGDKPTEQQFSNTIDSGVNLQDDKEFIGLKEYNPSKEYTAGDTVVKSEPIYQATVGTGSSGTSTSSAPDDAGASGGIAPAATDDAGSASPSR